MFKKCISLITLAAFVIFSLSCGTTKYVGEEKVAAWEGEKVKILSVTKTSGEFIKFSKESPVRIRGNAIVQTVKVIIERELIEINSADVKTKDPSNRLGTEIITKDGKKYSLVAYRPDEGKYIVRELESELYESISIPLSEVKEISIMRNAGVPGAIVGLLVGGGFGAGSGSTIAVGAYLSDQSGSYEPLYVIVPTCVGAVLGLVIGASKGVTDHYIITTPTDSTATIEE